MRRRPLPVVLALLAGLALATPTPAADAPVERVYEDAKYMLTPVPSWGDDGRLMSEQPEPTREQLVQRLTAAVRGAAAPSAAEVRDVDGQFRVTTHPAGHERVAALIQTLRDVGAPQLTIETRFLTIADDVAAELEPALRAKVHAARALQATGGAASLTVSKEQASRLIRATQASVTTTLITAPRLTIFNGQRAYVVVSTQKAYVADLKPIKGKDGQETYDPELASVESGVKLDVQAAVAADGKTVALRAKPWLSRLIEIESVERGRAANGEKLVVQRPRSQTFEADLVASVPADGSASVLLAADMIDATDKEPPQPVLILINARVAPPGNPG
jgi:hypothetical protein